MANRDRRRDRARLAVILLHTYGAEALACPVPAAGEGAIVRTGVDRLLARTALA